MTFIYTSSISYNAQYLVLAFQAASWMCMGDIVTVIIDRVITDSSSWLLDSKLCVENLIPKLIMEWNMIHRIQCHFICNAFSVMDFWSWNQCSDFCLWDYIVCLLVQHFIQAWVKNNEKATRNMTDLAEFNSLAPGRSECDFKNVIFNLVLQIGIFRFSHDNVLRWMPPDLTDDKSTLVQCLTASSHYPNQCWPRSISPYGVTRPNDLMVKCFMNN